MDEHLLLRASWDLRIAAAETLIKIEVQLRDALQAASAEDVIAMLEAFSPARSPGPEWTRTFDALVEHLWCWCAPSVLETAESALRTRAGQWAAVANALTPEYGAKVRARLAHPPVPSRMPPFTLG